MSKPQYTGETAPGAHALQLLRGSLVVTMLKVTRGYLNLGVHLHSNGDIQMGTLACCCKDAKEGCEKECPKWVGKEKPQEVYCINTWRYTYGFTEEAMEVPTVHTPDDPE